MIDSNRIGAPYLEAIFKQLQWNQTPYTGVIMGTMIYLWT